MFRGLIWTNPVPDVEMFMIFSIPDCTERSLNRSRIVSACSAVAKMPSFYHPLEVLVVRSYRYLPFFVFVSNEFLSYGSMVEE